MVDFQKFITRKLNQLSSEPLFNYTLTDNVVPIM